MKFTCTKEHLDRALRYSAKALAKHSTLPIIQNVLFSIEDGTLFCAATNLDVGVRIQMGAKTEGSGSVVVPPQLIASFIAAVGADAQITVTRNSDHSITIESGASRATIKGFDPVDFPPIPLRSAGDYGEVSVHAEHFRTTVARVVVSVAKTEARPELTGVNVAFDDGVLRIAATDGFRLSESVVTAEYGIQEMKMRSVIIPESAVSEVLCILSDNSAKKMTMFIGDGQIFFEIDGVTIVSRLISGTYPDYAQIIPQEAQARVVVDRSECERVLRLADAFANNTTSDMKVSVQPDDGVCMISAVSQDRGENVTTMSVDIEGEAQEVFLNTRYVLDGVTRCASERVNISFSGPAAPVVIRPVGDSAHFLYLVMPIRK